METAKKNNPFDFRLLSRVLSFVQPYKLIFYSSIVFSILLGVFSIGRPILIEYTVDNFIIGSNPEMLLNYCLIMVGLLLLEAVFQFVFMYAANWIGQSVIKDIRKKLFDKILSFRLKYFDETPIGALVTRTVSDIETIAEIFSQGVLVIFSDLFKIILIVSWMFSRNVMLSCISLAVFPVLIWATKYFQTAMKSAFEDERSAISKLNTFVQEHISGMKIVQIFNREETELENFKEVNATFKQATIKAIWHFSIFLPVIEIMSALSLGAMVWYGGLDMILGGEVTLGLMMSFILLINMLFRPVRHLADRINVLQRGIVAATRVFKILDTDERVNSNGNLILNEVKGAVCFKQVNFSYKEGEPVLRNINFEIEAGKTLALVGATGAGKSSIVNLLLRYYNIDSGTILLDGQDISKYQLKSLRTKLALVLQDVFLFSDSIYKNIVLDKDIPLAEVKEAAQAIGLEEFIEQLPGGYNYNVRERGVMLSAGQRQLIAFLRAYVSNPSVLILDEATSSVDSHTEELIQKATEKLTQGRTSIVIAHRLATIQNANKILVMEQGEIVESGTHAELIALKGYYSKLFALQFN
ncbi:MAG: ABC transporter ATP-binding protein [Flavobacteriales bacterium]|jgi:ATP-binding cassette subfamily B multidrug efflux pump|tara:strand:+ start:8556 stop:10304 length:1749 start_codon:yes stop_codon:yes gene_type:complete